MPFVLQKKDDPDLFVARPGTGLPFYKELQKADVFRTRDEAEKRNYYDDIIREVEIEYHLAD
jgi:hypothetical protein